VNLHKFVKEPLVLKTKMKFEVPFIIVLSLSVYLIACDKFSESRNTSQITNNSGNFKAIIISMIPEQYEVLDSISGDINFDKFSDFILIIKRKGESQIDLVDTTVLKRALFIFLGDSKQQFYRAACTENLVYCYNCGGLIGDPYNGIEIHEGSFTVYHYGGSNWRWTRNLTFRFDRELHDWFLEIDQSESFHIFEPEQVESNTQNYTQRNRVSLSKFSIYSK